jgi:hypothetical protein
VAFQDGGKKKGFSLTNSAEVVLNDVWVSLLNLIGNAKKTFIN